MNVVTPEISEKIQFLKNTSVSAHEIANTLGIKIATVFYHLNKNGTKDKTCLMCRGNFSTKWLARKFCGRDCFGKWRIKEKNKEQVFRRNKFVKGKLKSANQWQNKNGYFVKNMEGYSDQLIDYPSSPTGKAYIGIAKQPLVKTEYYGYLGVLLQDDSRQFVQCFRCGEWMKYIHPSHVERCSGITLAEYKDLYGLSPSRGLIADETAYQQTQKSLNNEKALAIFEKNRIVAPKLKYEEKSKLAKKALRSYSFMNDRGTCPEQLKERMKQFILNNKELPSTKNRGRESTGVYFTRFGTLRKTFEHYGLPIFQKRKDGKNIYKFPNDEMIAYNLRDPKERDLFLKDMLFKCPLFK